MQAYNMLPEKLVQVNSYDAYRRALITYIARGYIPVDQSVGSIAVARNRNQQELNCAVVAILALVFWPALIIYLIVRAVQRPGRVRILVPVPAWRNVPLPVYAQVAPDGQSWWDGNIWRAL